MASVFSDDLVVGKLASGKIKPVAVGIIGAPTVINQESAASIDAPNVVTPSSVADIDAPNVISQQSAGSVAAPNVLTPESAGAIDAPNVFTPIAQPIPANRAAILWDNYLLDADAPSVDNQKILQPNTYERASGTSFTFNMNTPRTVDAIAILGVYAGQTITIATATTSGGALSTVATVTPEKDRAVIVLLDPAITVGSVRVSSGSSFILSNIYATEALRMQRPLYGGHSPITLSQQTAYQSRLTDTGNFLSRNIVRSGLGTTFAFKNLTAEWVRDTFEPFRLAARTTPFFIAWRPEEYEAECAYAWTTGDIVPQNQGVRDLMDLSMQVRGYGD